MEKKTKEHLEKAKTLMHEMFEDRLDDIRLEQIEFDKKKNLKSCVFSFLTNKKYESAIEKVMQNSLIRYERLYKKIEFYENGEIQGILIFTP